MPEQRAHDSESLSKTYLQYAEMISELTMVELRSQNLKRIIDELRSNISDYSYSDSKGTWYDSKCIGLDFSGHAFKQLSERLEKLANENSLIYEDVFNKPSKSECLLLPSNLKSFIITLIADAYSKNKFTREKSKNSSDSFEYRYVIDIKKWSDDRLLQLICIVEDHNIKTGYFNWV